MPIPHRATTLQALKFYMLVDSPAVNNEIDLSKMNEWMGEDRQWWFFEQSETHGTYQEWRTSKMLADTTCFNFIFKLFLCTVCMFTRTARVNQLLDCKMSNICLVMLLKCVNFLLCQL